MERFGRLGSGRTEREGVKAVFFQGFTKSLDTGKSEKEILRSNNSASQNTH